MKLAGFYKFLSAHDGSQFFRRNTDPDTSHEAAEQIPATELEALVLEVIQTFPEGCISDQVVQALPTFGVQTITPRFAGLLRKGHIIDTGERRKASSGRSQRVMKAV